MMYKNVTRGICCPFKKYNKMKKLRLIDSQTHLISYIKLKQC